jgi:hypothetical protein
MAHDRKGLWSETSQVCWHVRARKALDVRQPDLPVFGPTDHASRSALWPVVRPYDVWPATLGDDSLQYSRDAATAEAGVSASSARHSHV